MLKTLPGPIVPPGGRVGLLASQKEQIWLMTKTVLDGDCSLSWGKCIISTWFHRQARATWHNESRSIWQNTQTRCSCGYQNTCSSNASACYTYEREYKTKIILLHNDGYDMEKLISYSVSLRAGQWHSASGTIPGLGGLTPPGYPANSKMHIIHSHAQSPCSDFINNKKETLTCDLVGTDNRKNIGGMHKFGNIYLNTVS